jgi:hypothetical protein
LKYDVHNGLVIIVPHVDREPQIRLFSLVLDYLAEMNDLPMNKLIEVLEDGTIHVREWTMEDHDIKHINNPTWGQP